MLQTQYSNPVQHIPQPKRSLVKSFAIRLNLPAQLPSLARSPKIKFFREKLAI
ncbi:MULTISPECIES: hypothetical protein [Microcoleaceae]|uniref:hypothetical protein n=1 Tax=Microcoleaceae TaxID=1892252 RepID=UPI001880DCAB|nr:hypothetical protein [Tychonema sp. LEGE 06208]MBE9165594.1 hypothetical protein [Tychonema sp. LEGE 06208]